MATRFPGAITWVLVPLAFIVPTVLGNGFDDVAQWTAFDPGDHGVGTDPDGYWGIVFDGRYLYFVPGDDGIQYHGEVLRYDSAGAFSETTSWAAYDPDAGGVGYNPVGYMGGACDGRYVYFSPFARAGGNHGEVLRYDISGAFAIASSWTAYDPGSNGVGSDPDGYTGAAYDGRYVYFAPFANGTRFHGEVLRYDTAGDFSTASSWAAYEAAAHGVGVNARGYHGTVFDGTYVYFVPSYNSSGYHGEVLRYDTTGAFAQASSWAAYDPGAHGVGVRPDGYVNAVFDGRYVYFTPLDNQTGPHGEFLRLDTTGSFTEVSSWTAFDPGNSGVGGAADGFAGGAFDGRFAYFSPHYDNTPGQDEVLRFDTTGSFADVSSWALFDPVGAGVGNGADGRFGAAFDGQYVYFGPYGAQPHGQVLRYDTFSDCNGNGVPDDCDLDCGTTGGSCDVAGCGQSVDVDGDGIPDECAAPIPAVSEWGLAAMTLLVLTAGALMLRARRRVPICHAPRVDVDCV